MFAKSPQQWTMRSSQRDGRWGADPGGCCPRCQRTARPEGKREQGWRRSCCRLVVVVVVVVCRCHRVWGHFFFTIILQLRYAQTHINTLHHIPCWSVFVLLETDLGPAPAPTIQYEEWVCAPPSSRLSERRLHQLTDGWRLLLLFTL